MWSIICRNGANQIETTWSVADVELISQIDFNFEIRSFKSFEFKYKMFKIVVVSPWASQ